MIDTIKKIWNGPFSVKISFVFIVIFILLSFLGNPITTVIMLGLIYAIATVISHLDNNDE